STEDVPEGEFSTPSPKYGLPGTTGFSSQVTQVMIPTMERAPEYSFGGTECPSAATCSPGPRYYIDSAITKTGKHVPPTALVTARPKTKIAVTPGPRAGYPCCSSPAWLADSFPPRHCTLSHRTDLCSLPIPFPGPAAYTLPRVMGPRTESTPAAPCYSMTWKSQHQSCFQDMAKTPGPAAFVKVDLDVYKPKAPKFTMGIKTKSVGTGTAPGPAEYNPGKLSVTKTRDPAFSFGIRHSAYEASIVADSQLD
uniref:ODF3A protein n=1 Tax=Catharus ustulatus TaxID=91951 RepID=A0A8C3TJ54_CATUS